MASHGYPHQPVPPPPREAWQRPVRVEPVPGTPYGLAIFGAPTALSGPAIGALVAGIAAILVSFVVLCFGLAGAGEGWGAAVGGAFAILAGFLGFAGVGLGIVGVRQVRASGPVPGAGPSGVGGAPATSIRGRGLAIAGLVCGASAVGLTLLSFAAVLAVQLSSA